jgi:hypothetical protein
MSTEASKKPSTKKTVKTPIVEDTNTGDTPQEEIVEIDVVSGPTALEEITEDSPAAALEPELTAPVVESFETPLEAPVSDSNVIEVESTTEVIIPNPFSPQTFITVPRAGGFIGDKRASYADQTGQIRSTRSY